MKCNGCGREHDVLGGVLGYGDVTIPRLHDHSDMPQGSVTATALYMKTLCPRCQHVMKDILLSSDLSEQWDTYEWSLIGEEYVEGYGADSRRSSASSPPEQASGGENE